MMVRIASVSPSGKLPRLSNLGCKDFHQTYHELKGWLILYAIVL